MADGFLNLLFVFLLAFEVKVNSVKPDLKARAVLQPCNINYRNIKNLENCRNKINVLIRSTINAKTKAYTQNVKINTIRDQVSGEDSVLLNPLVIKLQRKKPKLAYPLKPLKMVNNKAYEVFFQQESELNNPRSKNLIEMACGSDLLMEEQGFVCECDKTGSKLPLRRGQACSKKGKSDERFPTSTHCLKFDPVWYSVNKLKAPAVDAEVIVSVYEMSTKTNFGDVIMGGIHSPSNQKSVNGKVVVSLVHGKTAKIDPLQRNKNRLLIPAQDPMSTKKSVLQLQGNASEFLVVDKKLVNLSGEVCNSIGVSYRAFVKQKNRCSNQVQSCLDNQPMHFWLRDVARKLQGKQTEFFLSGFLNASQPRLFQRFRSRNLFLSFYDMHSHNASILVQINADQIKMKRNRSNAEIVSIDKREDGTIKVTLYNPGLVSQLFTVHLHSCNTSISQSHRKRINIYPYQIDSVVFALKDTSYWKRILSCTVSVQSSNQNMTERKFWYIEGEKCLCSSLIECKCQNQEIQYDFTLLENQKQVYFLEHLNHRKGLFEGPYATAYIIFLVLILVFDIGWSKAFLGLAFPTAIGQWGLCLFVKGVVLTRYYEKDLKECDINIDEKGVPIHPQTRKPVQMLPTCKMFVVNILFGAYLLFIPLHWLYLKLFHKNEEYKSRKEDNFSRNKLNSCVSDNSMLSPATERVAHYNSFQVSPDSLSNIYSDVSLDIYRMQKKGMTNFSRNKLNSCLSDNSMLSPATERVAHYNSLQVSPDSLSNIYSDVSLDIYRMQKKGMTLQKEDYLAIPGNYEEGLSENSSDLETSEKNMTKIQNTFTGSRSTFLAKKESLKTLLQTDPIYCNYENSPSVYLQNSGDNFSLCGILMRDGRKYKFQLGIYNTQTCHFIGSEVHRLTKPVRIIHPQQFSETMTASDVYRRISVQPTFTCLNSMIDTFPP